MKKISKAELGWMAAVIDMKGHVIRKANRSRRTAQLVLVVDIKDARIAQRLAAFTGSKAEVKPHMAPSDAFLRRGCASHCPEAHIHVDESSNWQMPEITRWTATGVAMAVVLLNLAPYMSAYEEYADDVDEALANMAVSGPGSGAVKAAVIRLAGLGWRVPKEVAHALGMKSTPNGKGSEEGGSNEYGSEEGVCLGQHHLVIPWRVPVPLELLPGPGGV
jgi:hypothetical protein